MYKLFGKRFLDLFIAISTLLVLSPLFLIILVILSVYYKGSPFFMQKRPGLGGRIFSVIKFKSMIDKFDADGKALPDRERITNVGVFIRKTSIDELPQLLNVIKGDMSFIGPRPLLVRYLPFYTDREQTRHNVRPGMTGLAQVNGRNNLQWEQRLELDAYYVENLSLKLDIQIILKTISKVIKGSDIKVIPSNKPLDVLRKSEGFVPRQVTEILTN